MGKFFIKLDLYRTRDFSRVQIKLTTSLKSVTTEHIKEIWPESDIKPKQVPYSEITVV